MVVDAIILHWEMVVDRDDARPEGFGRVGPNISLILYTDFGLLDYPRTASMKEALDALVGIFVRVGLHKNVEKTLKTVL